MLDGQDKAPTHLCEMIPVIHSLDKRVLVLENEVPHIRNIVDDNKKKLEEIDGKVDGISTHIAKQNGSLPRLEKHMDVLLTRVGETEKVTERAHTKAKIAWAILSAILTGALLTLLKFTLGV